MPDWQSFPSARLYSRERLRTVSLTGCFVVREAKGARCKAAVFAQSNSMCICLVFLPLSLANIHFGTVLEHSLV